MGFITSPDGNIYAIALIGGSKAVEKGFILLGAAPGELLEFHAVSTAVALAWRDALGAVLANYRPGRPVPPIDWAAIATEADPAWAAEQGGTVSESAPMPTRRRVRLAGSAE